MRRGLLKKYLGRSTPDHHQAVGSRAFLEVTDVCAHLFGQVHLRLAFFHVTAVEFLDVMAIEDRLARFHRLQEWFYLVE